jgi:hypothetical protein
MVYYSRGLLAAILTNIFLREGHDGPWSTFDFEIGTPAQKTALHPAISPSEVWLWNSTSCSGSEPCISTFSADQSSTWSNWNSTRDFNFTWWDGQDLYGANGTSPLGPANEWTFDYCAAQFYEMNYTGFAFHGKDIGSISINGSTSQKIQGPVAAGVLTTQQQPSLGLLGLNEPTECRSHASWTLSPSFMNVIRNETAKRNLAHVWSYTAGHYGRK